MRTRLFLLGAALAAFGASLGSSFHFDDYAIFSDPVLAPAAGWSEMWNLWIRHPRPLTYLTFWLNYQAGGGDPLGYHLLNLLLHLSAVLLAYACLTRLIGEQAALAASAIFALHPLQAEAVNYISARSMVLASVLCLASLLAWLKGRHWAAVAWFIAALRADEQAAAFPLALMLLNCRRAAPLAAMSSAAAVMTLVERYRSPAGAIEPSKYFLTQAAVILRYLRLLIVPYGFTVDPDIQMPSWWLGILAWITILAAIVAVYKYAGKAATLYFSAGLLLLLPSSSIFPSPDLSADRRMYLPMIAFSAFAGLLLARVKPISIVVTVAVILTALSVSRTLVWSTEASLWTEAVRRAPDKVRPKIQLARALPAGRALELLNQARELAPNDPVIAAEIGKKLLAEGQPDAALTEFARALALNPRDARCFNDRGVALQQLGHTEAARADFKRALELDPNFIEARQNLQKLPGQ
jgi:tetratricopeptide (TPR) repeat protein